MILERERVRENENAHHSRETVEVEERRRGEFVKATAPAASFEAMFACELFEWDVPVKHRDDPESSGRARTLTRCDRDYALPTDEIFERVHAVWGVSELPARLHGPAPSALKKHPSSSLEQQQPQQRSLEESRTTGYVTPAVLFSFYNIDASQRGSAAAPQSVFETGEQSYSQDDLELFESYFGLSKATVVTDDSHSSDRLCSSDAATCSEANLDVQYMSAVASDSTLNFVYVDERGTLDPFVSYAIELAKMDTVPLSNSISYGSFESENTDLAMATFDACAMKLGLRGATIFVSSGDDGAPGAISDHEQCGYNPSYPATCPHVTAVGATNNYDDWRVAGEGEVVCQSNVDDAVITSGGGFSRFFEAPAWGSETWATYLDATNPVKGYAAEGRGYPDLSLAGSDYEVIIGKELYLLSGTSCSAPSVAGMASLVNALRAAAGAAPIGFINPVLYATPTFANDVTVGDNTCVAEDAFCCDQGFNATAGWDAATGWGGVDYAKFEALFTEDLDAATLAEARQTLAKAARRRA